MTYFDVTEPGHLELIRTEYHDSAELKGAAAAAEADVIRAYTGREYRADATSLGGDPERFVYLDGYTADPAAAPADLASAIRATVADVLTWRVAQLKKNPLLDIHFANGASLNYKSNADDRFPKGWRWHLDEYDRRPNKILWAI